MRFSLGLAAATAAAAVSAIMIPPDTSIEALEKVEEGAGRHHGNGRGRHHGDVEAHQWKGHREGGWRGHHRGGKGRHHGGTALDIVDPYTQVFKVGCPGCLYAQDREDGKNGIIWTMGIENALLLNISVGNEPSTLELNGARFYPPVLSLNIEPPVPYIAQVPATASLADIKSHPKKYTSNPLRLTSWSFQAGTSQTINESGEELLSITLQLNALERQPITVPDITITALKNTDGQLALLKIETADTVPNKGSEECTLPSAFLCKWRAILLSKLSGFKGSFKGVGCAGMRGKHMGMFGGGRHGGHRGHGRPHPYGHGRPATNMHHGPNSHHDGAGDMDQKEGGHPHHKGHHGRPGHWKGWHHGMHGQGGRHGWHGHHHHHHGKASRIMHAVRRVLVTIIVPILLGIAAGMVTYLLGMVVGVGAAWLYRRVRGQRAQYQAVRLDEEDEVAECEGRGSLEKDPLLEEVEEDVPEYNEKQ